MKPQPEHEFGCFVPQLGQKAKPLWTSEPQQAQFMDQNLAESRDGAI
jgi:hypothetical protein